MSGAYDDIDSAANAFYGSIGDYDHKAEQSGAIYSDHDGKYHYSVPMAQADDNFKMRVAQNENAKLAAIFHTHPDASQSMLFSPQDVQVAQQLKVPSYIHFEHDGSLKKYIPGVTPVTRESVGSSLGAKVSKGELVKQILIAAALKE